jgi:hypothetical protein
VRPLVDVVDGDSGAHLSKHAGGGKADARWAAGSGNQRDLTLKIV